jgi:lysine 2,3-aminomutase
MTKALSKRSLKNLVDAKLLHKITPELEAVAETFSVSITPSMSNLIDREDPNDPIAKQFVPSVAELLVTPDEKADPISDAAFTPLKGIVHRHEDRVLLKLVSTCAVYCRFCFRREQLGVPETTLNESELEKALLYIASHPEIWEVILTGGDPLIASDRRLQSVIQRLNAMAHIKVIRIHTRMPVVDPSRITKSLLEALKGRAPIYVLLHCNHPKELTSAARAACALLVDAGIPLLSQSVLLKGVNDDLETLTELMRSFVECRVKPHYLHHGDLARGTSHFRLPLKKAQALLKAMRGISGLCQPTYILDIPGGFGKVPAGPHFACQDKEDWIVEDHKGQRHAYCDIIESPLKTLP